MHFVDLFAKKWLKIENACHSSIFLCNGQMTSFSKFWAIFWQTNSKYATNNICFSKYKKQVHDLFVPWDTFGVPGARISESACYFIKVKWSEACLWTLKTTTDSILLDWVELNWWRVALLCRRDPIDNFWIGQTFIYPLHSLHIYHLSNTNDLDCCSSKYKSRV